MQQSKHTGGRGGSHSLTLTLTLSLFLTHSLSHSVSLLPMVAMVLSYSDDNIHRIYREPGLHQRVSN
jgi:hypothetical protein